MPREFQRASRVAGQLQRELSELIRRHVKDPRVGAVTVTHVELSRDLAHARVHVCVLGAEGPRPEVVEALNHAAGFLRHGLMAGLKMRVVPELRFTYDEALDHAARLEGLIARANARLAAAGKDKA